MKRLKKKTEKNLSVFSKNKLRQARFVTGGKNGFLFEDDEEYKSVHDEVKSR